MSKKPAAPPQAGSEHSSYAACGANPAPTQLDTCENYHKSWEGDLQAFVTGASGYGSETSVSAMAAQGSLQRLVSYVLPVPAYEGGQDADHIGGTEVVEQSQPPEPEPRGAGDITSQWVASRRIRRPSYVPPLQRRREVAASPRLGGLLPLRPPGVMPHGSAPPSKTGLPIPTLTPEDGSSKDDQVAPTGSPYVLPSQRQRRRELAARPSSKTISLPIPTARTIEGEDDSSIHDQVAPIGSPYVLAVSVLPSQRQRRRELAASPSLAGPGGLPLPPPGSTHVMPHGAAPTSKTGLPTAQGVTTPTPEDDSSIADELAPMSIGSVPRLHPRRRAWTTLDKIRHRRGPGLYCIACRILSCLLALVIGFVLLVIYLRYQPQSPRMRVTKASFNSTLGVGGQAANYSVSIQADIYNPNTQLHVVLRYIQLDLYFQGSLIGTQAVWPAPIHEAPGDSVLRSVQLLVSVTQQQDVSAWHNVTNGNSTKPLELRLVGRFHSQLNFGRCLPLRFWVYPRCTLWLDLLRGGALRQSWC